MRNLKFRIEGNGLICDVLHEDVAIVFYKCFAEPCIYKNGVGVYSKDLSDETVSVFYKPASKQRTDKIRRRKYAKRLKD